MLSQKVDLLFFSLGLVKDDCSLRDLKITSGAKMMVVGSTISDVITVQAPSTGASEVELGAVLPGKCCNVNIVSSEMT